MSLKRVVYSAAQRLGMFPLTRAAMRHSALILAYHGFEVGDETQFRPKLFIRAATFRRHLQILKDGGFNVVPLGEIVAGIARGDLPPKSVAITIDDGFASTLAIAAPMLAEFGFPATVYVTTYYMLKQSPVFDLAVGYLLWKGSLRKATVTDFVPEMSGTWNLASSADYAALEEKVLELGHRAPTDEIRQQLCRSLAVAVGVDYAPIVNRAAFRLLSFDEARQLAPLGIELGLHTHRHTFPADSEETCKREIEDNRRVIEREIGVRAEHFCYPSGYFARHQGAWLQELGVRSATTCETGLVSAGDSPFFLNRFLDGEMVSDIEFEAELSGFAALVRRLSGRKAATVERH